MFDSVFRKSQDFPGGSDGKASVYNMGDRGSIPGPLLAFIHEFGISFKKEMATHSSIHAWKIPWTEEPGGLQSMGSQGVGHDWATSVCVGISYDFIFLFWSSSDIYYLMYFNIFILQIIMRLNCIENNNIASKNWRISIPQNAKSCSEVCL